MKKAITIILSALTCSAWACDCPCRKYVNQGLSYGKSALQKMHKEPLYESMLETPEEEYLFWSGYYVGLEQVEQMEHHDAWVKENDLVWNGVQWVKRHVIQ